MTSLALNENASPDVRADLETWLGRAVPDGAPFFRHTLEGPDDMPAHVKAVLTGPSLTLPVTDGRLALGTWQGVYLCEHRDEGGPRSLTATLWGEPVGGTDPTAPRYTRTMSDTPGSHGQEPAKATFEVASDRARGIVTVRGDLDLAHCGDLGQAILAVEENRPAILVVDLRQVVHIDSTGLRVILDASTRADAAGRRLVVVVEPGGPVGKVLELTLVTDRIEVVGDLAAAKG